MRRCSVESGSAEPSDSVQYRWLTMAAGAAPRCASSAVRPRPTAGWTPTTLKKSLDTVATIVRVGSVGPMTGVTQLEYFAIELNVRFRSRKSSKLGSASRENVPRWLTSHKACKRSGAGYGNGRSKTPYTTLKIAVVA